MDEQTLTALRGSIEKWEEIVAGTGEDRGMDNCALCQMFCEQEDSICVGCPVMQASGDTGCKGTPYTAWRRATAWRGRVTDESTKALAQAELDFLRSLLPEGA